MCENDHSNLNADPDALQEVIEVHMSIDSPAEQIVLSNDVYDQMFYTGEMGYE